MVDLPFEAVSGNTVKLPAKKSSSRESLVSDETVDAVKQYQHWAGKTDSDIMFPGGIGHDPSNKWVKKVKRYYKDKLGDLGNQFQTHNIRKTAITEFYNKTKDIVSTQKFVGHSDIKVTQLYVAKDQTEINGPSRELFMDRKDGQKQNYR